VLSSPKQRKRAGELIWIRITAAFVIARLKRSLEILQKINKGYMSTENLFKPSNRKECRGVVLANILESVGICLDRSKTYSHRVCLWQKNPQFGQSIYFDTRRKQET